MTLAWDDPRPFLEQLRSSSSARRLPSYALRVGRALLARRPERATRSVAAGAGRQPTRV
jgi:hypothetical protein